MPFFLACMTNDFTLLTLISWALKGSVTFLFAIIANYGATTTGTIATIIGRLTRLVTGHIRLRMTRLTVTTPTTAHTRATTHPRPVKVAILARRNPLLLC